MTIFKTAFLVIIILLVSKWSLIAQTSGQSPRTSAGIGIYPTGTETGFGYRSSRTLRLAVDVRITRTNIITRPKSGSFVNEASLIYRVAYLDKIRFHVGLGGRADWNLNEGQSNRFGIVTPIGVEAFPFPFQHAGLFFEAAPFCTWSSSDSANLGIRTVGGFVLYFLRKDKN